MADTKITGLDALALLLGTDIFPVVDDPGGTPLTQKITAKNLLTGGADIIPAALAYHNADQAIANVTTIQLALNSEVFDTDGIHDTVTNNSRLTCQTAGKYFIYANVQYSNDNSGYRRASIWLNATTHIAFRQTDYTATFDARLNLSCIYDLSVSDYVEIQCRHNGGSGINLEYAASSSPFLGMIRIGD